MNICIFTGRLTKDPVIESTNSGKKYTRFSLAVSRGKVKEGQQGADFVPCIAWNNQAEAICNYLHKGSLIEVNGQFNSRQYESQNGEKRTAYEVVVFSFGFLESKKAEAKEEPKPIKPPKASPISAEEGYIESENIYDDTIDLPFTL